MSESPHLRFEDAYTHAPYSQSIAGIYTHLSFLLQGDDRDSADPRGSSSPPRRSDIVVVTAATRYDQNRTPQINIRRST